MPTITLVRHGQASFGAADYDQLSDLGQRQCQRLGEYFRQRDRRFMQVLRGSLKRHAQSLAALQSGLGELPEARVCPELNEYDSHAVIRTVFDGPLTAPKDEAEYRHHFRLLRQGLTRWVAGEVVPEGMPPFAQFRDGILQTLAAVQQAEGDVLVVSSGGPISTAVAAVLGAPAETLIELNLRIRNSALTELAATPKRLMLHSFNHVPHLDDPALSDWITYA
jgi:broad specificity phosphatase PhoE